MIRPLRRAHLLAWGGLAFVLPLVIASALVSRPDTTISDLPGAERVVAPLEREVAVVDREDARFALRTDGSGSYQVEVLVKRPFSHAAVALHAADGPSGDGGEGSPGPLIGVLGSRGLFRFAMAHRPGGLLMVDPVRGEVIGRVELGEER